MWLQQNPRFTRLVVALALALVTAASHPVLTQDQTALRGVVVEDVGSGSAGEKAGIRAGDVLLSWVRAAAPPANPDEARGEIGSPFDLADVEIEQAPRGEVRILGTRDGRNFSVVIPPGAWDISARPVFAAPMLRAYQQARERIAAKQIDAGIDAWRALASQANIATNPELAAWLWLRIGDTLRNARRWDDAHVGYRAALEVARGDSNFVAQVWEAEGMAFEAQSDFPNADAAFREAVRIRETLSGQTVALARSLYNLGNVARLRGDLRAAEEFLTRSLSIREQVAPGSLEVSASLNVLGLVAERRGNLTGAEELYRRSLDIRERLAPDSLAVANTLNNLGMVVKERDLSGGEDFYRRSLAITERVAPDSLEVAGRLNNLGIVAYDRGDLAAAEDFYRRSLALKEKLAPDSLTVALTLNNLGLVAKERGDLAAAEEFYKRSLALKEKLAPGSLTVSLTLGNLGGVFNERGDPGAAGEFYSRAVAIQQKIAPGSLPVAGTLTNLGQVAYSRGDLAAAEALHKQSLAIGEKEAPSSLVVASSLTSLGDLAIARGDLAAAETLHTTALTIRQKLAPGSSGEAKSLYTLGSLARRSGRDEVAAGYFQRAITALETQAGKLGGAEEVRTGFNAQYASYYRDYIGLLLDRGKADEAFHVLERSRARSLLAMLAERDLVFAADLPANLARERTVINTDYDRTQAAIAALNPGKDAAEIDRRLARLRELRDKREEIGQTIRKTSPRFASLMYPQPLDLAGAQSSLDPETVLLAYSVAKEKTFLFVVQPARPVVRAAPPVSVFTLPIGEAALREKVSAIRNLIQRGAQTSAPADGVVTAGRELFALLIEPARALVAASDRVLISPDGPLHTLPFAALAQPSARGPARYFVEWKPLHVVASATVYAELKKTRRSPGAAAASLTLAAFGDPRYPPSSAEQVERMANPEVRATLRRGYALEPLPASRREVEAIARLYGDRAATYLGDQATEERAKAIGNGARYLHFASHGLLDERFPLNSALALTIPARPAEGQANGLLQAWEIFEQMRIDADLVTLSACETGLGKELGGEGLVGLTRAFQYAGARTVLASLWSVGDDSTADLMTRFYGHLKAGRTKDEALRAAQLEMIRARQSSHPFQWAAFQLAGDWR